MNSSAPKTPDDLHQPQNTLAQDVDRTKARFLAMVSHEIRTPLNGIIGMGKLLSDTRLTEEQHAYVDAITSSGEQLLLLVNDLIAFGRIQSGDAQARPESVDLQTLLAGVAELMATQAHAKGLDLGYHLASDVPETICIVPGRLRQVLFNVIGNAVKFTETGGVKIVVTRSASHILIAVSDTGPGVERQAQARIFQAFEQAEGGYARSHDGAGLGLAIARKLTEAAGGTLTLDSEPGKGSCFTLALPCSDDYETELSPKPRRQPINLQMDDGPERDCLVAALEANGHPILDTDTTPIVIVDARLGEKALNAVRKRSDIQSIALIPPGARGSVGAEFKADGQFYLTRPVRPSTLKRVLEAAQTASQVDARPKAAAAEQEAPQPDSATQLSILIAEDNPVNALLTKRMLQMAGHRVIHVEDGARAIEEAKRNPVDAILMDMHMPVMDGIEAIKAIRQREEELGLRPVPIFALTADETEEIHHSVANAGASRLLPKPLSSDMVTLIEDEVQTS